MRFKSIIAYPFSFIILLLCFLNSNTSLHAQNKKSELSDSVKTLISELNKCIHPVSGSDPSLNNADLAPFDIFAGTKIIGLGEASHGTKEFFQMKHRLFKYFVEKHGYKIFGFEADMGECIYIDRFICKGTGTLDSIIAKMQFWTWRTEEVKDLILWMRKYNENRLPENQIHFLGFDCQSIPYIHNLLTGYFTNRNFKPANYSERILTEINSLAYEQLLKLTQPGIDLYKAKCDSVIFDLERNKEQLISKEEQKYEFEQMKRLLIQAKQVFDVATNKSWMRDPYMAENAIWLSNLYGKDTKILLWAHNGHVSKNPLYSGLRGSMGNALKKELGTQYKVIGFSLNFGTLRAVGIDSKTGKSTRLSVHTIPLELVEKSTNYIFSFAEPMNFYLIVSEAGKSKLLYDWLNKPRIFFAPGAVFSAEKYKAYYGINNITLYFDAIIHFHNTNASVEYIKTAK